MYDTVDAPVSAGQRVGTVVYSYNGLELARVDAVAKDGVDSDGLKSVLESIKGFLFGDTMKTILYIVLGIIGAWIVFSLVMAVVRTVKRVQNKRNGSEKTKKEKKKAPKKKKHDVKSDTKEL